MSRVSDAKAIRVVVGGDVQGVRDETLRRARALMLMGWARDSEDGTVQVHAEGGSREIDELVAFLREGRSLAIEPAKVEGHEQFALRGVSAGIFVVREHAGRFELRLEVEGEMRSWSLPRGPSLDPAVKRLAVEVGDQPEAQGLTVWDRGSYEQGGRVPWPEAIGRGHAVFVLHGEKLRGGYALQRTRPPQWLLIKRRDAEARPGSDIVAERPDSVG